MSHAQLAEGEDKAYHDLLCLFAYGTWGEYKKNKDTLPPLNAAQETKLRQLTIVTMCSAEKHISYDTLLQALDMNEVRQLEDLIIECIYAGLLRAKLDQRSGFVEVQQVMGRDLRPGPLVYMNTSSLEIEEQRRGEAGPYVYGKVLLYIRDMPCIQLCGSTMYSNRTHSLPPSSRLHFSSLSPLSSFLLPFCSLSYLRLPPILSPSSFFLLPSRSIGGNDGSDDRMDRCMRPTCRVHR